MRKTSQKRHHFVSSNEKAKSKIIARFVQIARKDRLSYDDFLYVCQQARRKLDLRRPKRERKLPQLLAEVDLKRFFRVIQDCGDVEHEIMLKFLFLTKYGSASWSRSRLAKWILAVARSSSTKARGRNVISNILQRIFSSASRRETLGKHLKGGRRGGGLKIDWTKPLPRA